MAHESLAELFFAVKIRNVSLEFRFKSKVD